MTSPTCAAPARAGRLRTTSLATLTRPVRALRHALARAAAPWIPAPPLLAWRFRRAHGHLPNLLAPHTLNEKVLCRILFERDPRLTVMADKLLVRDFVQDRVGGAILPRLLWSGDDPAAIPFDSLPDRFVVKPTHGSGWVEVVRDSASLEREALVATCRRWLSQDYYARTREWGYKRAGRRILVEELIDDGTGSAPTDYKLFVFGGTTRFILVTMGRFAERAHVVVRPDWSLIDVTFDYSALRRHVPPPPHLAEMIAAADRLGRDLGFVRVDLYDTPDRLIFGEMTMTPGGSLDRLDPPAFDRSFGALWTAPALLHPAPSAKVAALLARALTGQSRAA